MENNNNIIQRIEDYLDELMSQEDKIAFENELKENDTLRKELALHEDIRKAVSLSGRQDLKAELNTYYKSFKSKEKSLKFRRILIPVMSAAATILLAIFVFTDNKEINQPSDQFITLDSTGMHKTPEYADSAIYKDSISDDFNLEIKE